MGRLKTKLIHLLLVFASAMLASIVPLYAQNIGFTTAGIAYTKKTYTYKAVGDHKIQLDVYRPEGREKLPVIMWIHGGALIVGTRWGIDTEQLETYIRAGFAVVAIDYRLAPETKLAEIIEDLKDAYAWVLANGPGILGIDPDRVAVAGHSAGGYLTLMAGVCLDPRPDALVSFYGYGDITGPWYSEPDSFYNSIPAVSKEEAYATLGDSVISGTHRGPIRRRIQFYLYCRQNGLWPQEVSGHDPKKELSWFAPFEPLKNITKLYPPTILLHGRKDTDVPFEQSERVAAELKRQGIDHELVANADWGHGFDDALGLTDPAVREAYVRVVAFLRKHVR